MHVHYFYRVVAEKKVFEIFFSSDDEFQRHKSYMNSKYIFHEVILTLFLADEDYGNLNDLQQDLLALSLGNPVEDVFNISKIIRAHRE